MAFLPQLEPQSEAPIISLLNTAERAARNYSNSRADPSQATPHAPFLEQLFRLYDEKKADFRAIHDCCSSNIAAGSDTTAITISAALYFLHHEPDRLAKLREETDGAVKDSEFIKVDDALAMPYLMSVAQETLRLHPAFGAGARRCIGKHLALIMIGKGIAEIVRNFDLELDASQKECKVESAWFVWLNYSCRVRARDKWFCARTGVTTATDKDAIES
ncbi:hypothetical protein MANI_110905 [Metarhizium anisopliae]|nr:hypothetical protein MANI_110905 [Metarhizium anisopliae]